jgi:hemolysin D
MYLWQTDAVGKSGQGSGEGKYMEKTRLLVVDDEALFRELLCRTLSAEPELEVIGVAGDGETAVQLARKEKPDVVIMDIELPGKLDGIEAALQIKKERPQTGIVVLSAHSERRYVTSLPLEDIQGWAYLLKQTAPDLATVVRAIARSGVQQCCHSSIAEAIP